MPQLARKELVAEDGVGIYHSCSFTSRRAFCRMIAAVLGLAGLAGSEFVLAESDKPASETSRTLVFPSDRCVGRLCIAYGEAPSWAERWRSVDYHAHWDWVYHGVARGNVEIPAHAKVKLQVNAAGTRDMSWTSRLASDDLHTLAVNVQDGRNSRFGDVQMRHLARLTGLEELELRVVHVTDRGLESLEPLQSLKVLDLRTPVIGSNGLKSLGKLGSLESLVLGATEKCDQAGLVHLAKLKSLREFVFGGSMVPPPALARLATLPSLIYVWSGEDFSDEHLAALKGAKSLKGLRIQGARVTDRGLRHLRNLNTLEYLDLWHTRISDAGLVHLKSLPALKRLNVRVVYDHDHPRITAKGIALLAEIPSLEHLDLPNFGMTDECCRHVSRLSNLEYLWIGCSTGGPITDEGVEHLSRLRHLQSLNVGGTGITDAGMDYIARLENLTELRLSAAPQLSDAGLASLASLKRLTSLSLPRFSQHTAGTTVPGLRRLNHLSNLRILALELPEHRNPDEDPLDISGLAQLERLHLYRPRNADLACLSRMEHLKELLLCGASIGDAGVAHLESIPSLSRLQLGGPTLTDAGLATLSRATNLSDVIFRGSFSGKGLASLDKLQGLEMLRIETSRELSPRIAATLRESLPNLLHFTLSDKRVFAGQSHSGNSAKAAPVFQATALDGTRVDLRDYRGKVVLLYFWATWCKPCVAATPELITGYEGLRKEHPDAEMISLSLDSGDAAVRKHVDRYKLPWKQVRIGANSKIAADYGISGVPRFIVVDRKGVIRHDGRMNQALLESLKAALEETATSPAAGAERVWTDATGRYRTTARVLKIEDGEVQLKKKDGEVISIPLDKLSEADRQFVESADRE